LYRLDPVFDAACVPRPRAGAECAIVFM
jgi:hypothetical protein